MTRKVLSFFAVLMTVFLAITSVLPQPAQAAQSEAGTQFNQEKIEQGLESPGVLRVGMEANYAPFNWTQTSADNGAIEISNAEGQFANGYDLQIAKRLADSLGLKLEIVKLDWDGLPPALESGKIDAIIAGMSPTPERLRQIDFSDPYYNSDIVVVTRKDSPYANAKSLEDLEGARLTGQLNTFHYDLIDQVPNVQKETAMDSFPTMISSVLSDKIDGYISERPGALAALAANDELSMVSFEEGQGFDLGEQTSVIAVGLRKSSPLTSEINTALATISEDERNQIMEEMVDLNQRNQEAGFWGEVAGIWKTYSSQFIKGAANTMFIALVSTLIGFFIGLLVAIYRTIKVPKHNQLGQFIYKVVDFFIMAYIEIFRGTPMMVQAMLIFYGSKLFFNIDMSSMFAALLIVSVNTGAYLAEVIRGGIIGVDDGQSEAAKAIGMNHFQTMTYVVLPQAIRSILPALGNEFVINIKDTSVLNVIAVTELFFVTRSAAGTTYLTFQTFFITSIIYFVLTFTTTRILRLVEHKMSGSDSYTVYQSSTSEVEIHD